MSFSSRIASKLVQLVSLALLLSTLFSPTANAATTSGLYGSADPTYDGVFRQSLSIIALKSAGASVPSKAINWLVQQQCPNGGFEGFRDPANECKPSNPTTYTGIDSSSTALAAVALAAVGKKVAAAKAVRWLQNAQNGNGGMPYFRGGSSDAASTALALIAARAVGLDQTDFTVKNKNLVSYMRMVMLTCDDSEANRGSLAYSKTKPLYSSNMTSSQALAALTGALYNLDEGDAVPTRLACGSEVPKTLTGIKSALAGHIAKELRVNSGVMQSEFGSGTDWGSTAWAVIGLAGSGYAAGYSKSAVTALSLNLETALDYKKQEVNPGRAALIILAAVAAEADPRDFGKTNLVKELQKTLN